MNPSPFSTGGGDGDGDTPMKNWRDAPPRGLNFLHSPSPSMRLEQEVAWNPAQIYVDLQAACQVLSDRGWKLAAKWAAEQWMGLPAVAAEEISTLPPNVSEDLLSSLSCSSGCGPMFAYAKTLLDLGEFAHAAAVLSQPHATVERMPPPLSDVSAAALSMRAYALYMAGERRKEEGHHESSRYVQFFR